MTTLHFEGASDDTFGLFSPHYDTYDNCASMKPIRYLVETPDGQGLVVFGQYCPEPASGWMIGIARHPDYDDDIPIPAWPMLLRQGKCEYTPRLVIEAPDDVTIKCLEENIDDD